MSSLNELPSLCYIKSNTYFQKAVSALRQVLTAIEMSGLENKLDRANPGCVTLIRETLEEAGYPVRKADYE